MTGDAYPLSFRAGAHTVCGGRPEPVAFFPGRVVAHMISLVIFIISFSLAYLGTVSLLKVRLRKGFVDVPNIRSSHEEPKARFGGIAIVGSFYAAYAILLFTVPGTRTFLPFAAGAFLLFLGGVIDDWRGLSVKLRFAIQITSAIIIVSFSGVVDHIHIPMAGEISLGAFSIPFTLLFILVCVNFYNFIDGIDGLAAGSAFIAAGFISLIAYILGHIPLALLSLAVAGAALGFLQFNFPPSRLFMGDGGSTFLGFFFAYIAIAGNRLVPELPIFIPVLILSSLYLDAGLTLIKRGLKGERILDAHHTHYYQRLLSLGLNHKQVTILEYALTVLLGVSAVIYFKAGGLFPVFLTACWVVIFTALIMKIRSLERGDRLFWEKRTLFVVAVDLLLITVAYMGAYFLRLNFRFTQPEGIAMLKAFPIVLVVRSACFHRFGLYRGVWKYTSTEDLIKIIKAVTTGSAIILVCVVLLYRFVAFPRSLFIIEYFLLIVMIGGARFAFRVFHEFGKEAHGARAKRIAVIGAGDFGDQTAREIKNSEKSKAQVVCFVDDDKEKIGLTLRGHPILGPVSAIEEICEEQRIDALVLAVSKLPSEKMREIVDISKKIGVPIERRDKTLLQHEESTVVLFDRLARSLGRDQLFFQATEDPEADLQKIFKGKSILVTGGSAPITPVLVRELSSLGASVTVQLTAPAEAEALNGARGERMRIFMGGLSRQADVTRLIEVSAPEIVFLCLTLESPEAINSEEYLWRRVVRETDLLVRSFQGHYLTSFNALIFWQGVRAGSIQSLASAAAEATVLNAEEFPPAATNVIRFPRVLTEKALRQVMDQRMKDASEGKERFDLLETEVVMIALRTAIHSWKRALFVPTFERSFSRKAVRAALSDKAVRFDSGASAVKRGEDFTVPVHPLETSKPSAVRGLQEVSGPLCPADGRTLEAVSRLCFATRAEARNEALEVLSATLGVEFPGKIDVFRDGFGSSKK